MFSYLTNRKCYFMFITLVVLLLVTWSKVNHYNYFKNVEENDKRQYKFREIVFSGNKHRLAVIVPYRNVLDELQIFIPHLHNFLHNQSVDHEFFIIRQADNLRFNKGSLVNIGYLLSRDTCNYLVIHDIDTLPLNPQLQYKYPEKGPWLLSPAEYHPEYHGSRFSGGILLLTMDHFKKVKGMTNNYWGWGGEDNEFRTRILKNKLNITSPHGLRSNKTNTFLNLHDSTKRPRDKGRFNTEKKNVFKLDKSSGYYNVNYHLKSSIKMAISGVEFTMYNVELKCESDNKWCRY